MGKRGYDPARLRRACLLKCDHSHDRVYKVSGSDEPYYYVNLDDPTVPCTCADSMYRGNTMCKHELCARLHAGDHALIMALGSMLLTKQQNNETAGLE